MFCVKITSYQHKLHMKLYYSHKALPWQYIFIIKSSPQSVYIAKTAEQIVHKYKNCSTVWHTEISHGDNHLLSSLKNPKSTTFRRCLLIGFYQTFRKYHICQFGNYNTHFMSYRKCVNATICMCDLLMEIIKLRKFKLEFSM